ncbi:MAG: leucyl/phenylalanyl-tRNA--protein transferase [Fimbriimonas sp.]|nr:leucyl/phenylalanyl-tRNA--protein transferase [Fimbriimonas sp.]
MNGKDLRVEMLREAYAEGWFPMTVDEEANEVEWFQPYERCLFPIEGIRVSRSLRKTLSSHRFKITFDRAFEDVMWACRRPDDNWITEDFVRVYGEAHQQGWGHSCEVWLGDELVGGTYGIALGGAFFAESMFHRVTDASKVALFHMIETCRARGFVLFDAQIMNPHLESLGAYTINNQAYMRMMKDALSMRNDWSA